MYESNLFEMRDHGDWDDKDDDEKTWEEAQEFFEKLVERMDRYERNQGGTAKKARFESTNNVRQHEQAQRAADDAILNKFVRTQTQGSDQLKMMTANQSALMGMQGQMQKTYAANNEQIQAVTSNQSSIVDMQSNMRKMMATMQQQLNESNNKIAELSKQLAAQKTIGGGGGKVEDGEKGNTRKRWQPNAESIEKFGENGRTCGVCKRTGAFHADADCWADPKNTSKRPQGYVLPKHLQ